MKYITALVIGSLFLATPLHAEPPCDFKGVSVGSKMTPAGIMTALGVPKFKINPTRLTFDQAQPNVQKFGLLGANEIEDWNIGSYCDTNLNSCDIPYEVHVGNKNEIPVSVHVGFYNGQVTEIDVSFPTSYWDEVRPILDQKYGADWKIDRDEMFLISAETTKDSTVEKRITLNHVSNGMNQGTKDRCQIWATNFDRVFTHPVLGLGPFQSVFVIKLISKNF